MNDQKGLKKIIIPKYSLCEELLNSISHGVGALISAAILVLCVIRAALLGNVYGVVSCAIYGASSFILYTISCLYHAFRVNNAKRVFRIFDHAAIYFYIAGTYTPFALVTLREYSTALGWSIFGVIWGLCIIGIVFTSINMNSFKKLGMLLYIIMGWLIIGTIKIVYNSIGFYGFLFLLLGGIIYTIGAVLYLVGKKKKYFHSIFHFLVVIATVLFFFSVFFFVL